MLFRSNAALTTEIGKAGSHLQIWEPFMKHLLGDVLAFTGIPVIFFGKEAAKLEKLLAPMSWSFAVSHPASASYAFAEWDSEGVFTKVNNLIKGTNDYKINWLTFTE